MFTKAFELGNRIRPFLASGERRLAGQSRVNCLLLYVVQSSLEQFSDVIRKSAIWSPLKSITKGWLLAFLTKNKFEFEFENLKVLNLANFLTSGEAHLKALC